MASLFILISSVHLDLCLILLCALFSQKDVDLSKDDLLGDILQDLHSEVSSLSLQLNETLYFHPQVIIYSFFFFFFAETNSSDSSTSCHSEEKEVSRPTYEPLLHKTSDAKGLNHLPVILMLKYNIFINQTKHKEK